MSRLLIIGYGNPLRGDDGIGPAAADRLRDLLDNRSVDVVSLHQLTPELAQPISLAERIVFIDAAVGPAPGSIVERKIEPSDLPRAFTHHATPEGLLAMARSLYGRAPQATLMTVTAAQFEFGSGLSPVATTAVAALVERISSLLAFR